MSGILLTDPVAIPSTNAGTGARSGCWDRHRCRDRRGQEPARSIHHAQAHLRRRHDAAHQGLHRAEGQEGGRGEPHHVDERHPGHHHRRGENGEIDQERRLHVDGQHQVGEQQVGDQQPDPVDRPPVLQRLVEEQAREHRQDGVDDREEDEMQVGDRRLARRDVGVVVPEGLEDRKPAVPGRPQLVQAVDAAGGGHGVEDPARRRRAHRGKPRGLQQPAAGEPARDGRGRREGERGEKQRPVDRTAEARRRGGRIQSEELPQLPRRQREGGRAEARRQEKRRRENGCRYRQMKNGKAFAMHSGSKWADITATSNCKYQSTAAIFY